MKSCWERSLVPRPGIVPQPTTERGPHPQHPRLTEICETLREALQRYYRYHACYAGPHVAVRALQIYTDKDVTAESLDDGARRPNWSSKANAYEDTCT